MGDIHRQNKVLGHMALVLVDGGRLDEARTRHTSALESQAGERGEGARALHVGGLAQVERERGNLEEARSGLLEARGLHRDKGHRFREGIELYRLGALEHERGA